MTSRRHLSTRQIATRARRLLRVLSLGAGVQSSTVLLMAARGELVDKPDVAIFADTRWEPKAIYRWLDYLRELAGDAIPILHVSRASDERGTEGIRESFYTAKSTGKRFVTLPVFVLNPDGTRGMAKRQCTKEFKIEPITAKIRELVGLRPGQIGPRNVIVEQWFGISADEIVRMKDSRIRWIRNRYPLVDLGMTRDDCLAWWDRQGLPRPPKSACIGCPYTSDDRWEEMQESAPDEWADAVAFDRMIREGGPNGAMRGRNYLHRSCIPLDEVEFGRDYAMQRREREGQGSFAGMLEECEGMCGV